MKQRPEKVSAILLAGGRSSRMGRNKAELDWFGGTLLEHQVGRLRSLGIGDIMLSGYPKPMEGTRFVADKYPLRGPLGGIHAGLLAANEPHCLVLSVDTPLVPSDILTELINAHIREANNITVISHGEYIEPLIGVYERWLGGIAEQVLQGENSSVRTLFRRVGISRFEYSGDPALLSGCNTPEEYEGLRRIAEDIGK